MRSLREVERSIIKSRRSTLWSPFVRAVREYDLVEAGDKIAIAISGGKDSFLLAKLFQELKRHGKYPFELEFITMDPGYRPEIRATIERTAKELNIPLHIYDTDVFEIAELIGKEKPCYLCARMRRGSLYDKAQELGCNKLALGHHFDDVIETVLMNVLFSANFKTMMPKLHSTNFENMELIRPMVYIHEEEIIQWTKSNEIDVIDCACTVTQKEEGTARSYTKKLIQELKEDIPNVEMSIYRAPENVEMGAILGWKDLDQHKHHFLDYYRQKERNQ